MKRFVWMGLLGLLTGVFGCGRPAHESQPAPAGQAAEAEVLVPADTKGIRTAAAELKPIPDYLQVPARIEPDPTRVIRVFPPVVGRLSAVEVRPGDHVRKGQMLALLESSEVAGARADYQKARADKELKEQALRRASLLYENQVLSQKEYQQSVADAQMAEAELERTADRLRVLGIDLEGSSDQFRVLAPRSGVILDIGGAAGEFSKSLDASQPLCTLADLGAVWVVGEVFEKDVAGLKTGAAAEVTLNAYPGGKWSGRVAALLNAVDPVTRTLKVRVVLPNPGLRLKPGMFASLRMLRSSSPGVVIPAVAVLREGSASYVFVERSAGHFERRGVTLGRAVDNEVEVTSGLRSGEVVVTEGALLLRAATS